MNINKFRFRFSYNLFYTGFILFIYLLIFEVDCKPVVKNHDNDQILIVVSYDGFMNKYIHKDNTPYMLEFRKNGIYTDYLVNVFPTKTFTNHHSIATGLYPEVHGVTANEIYDRDLGFMKYSYDLFHYNPEILPIWALNEKNGGKSGCMMWPGSNFEYQNITCTYMQSYNSKIPLKERIDTVITWLKNPINKRPNLIMVYFETPDKIGHVYGPDSPQVTNAVKQLDNMTKYLQDEVARLNLTNQVNVIHLSDHGMIGVNSPNFIDLTSFLEPNTAKFYGTSPVLQVVPVKGKEEDVYTRLKNAAVDNGHFHVYKVDTLPEKWHAKNEKRFGPIIVLADSDYAFQDMYRAAEYYNKQYNVSISPESKYGVHGYDNVLKIMHPIFMAKGPLFKDHTKVEPFYTVDLYNLFCKILNIENPPKTNGTDAVISLLLKNDKSTMGGAGTGLYIGVAILLAIMVAVIGYLFMRRKVKRNFYLTS